MINDIVIAFLLFFAGCFGVIISRNHLVRFIIAVEIITLSAIYVFALSALKYSSNASVTYAILLLPIAAIEIAVYLAMTDKESKK